VQRRDAGSLGVESEDWEFRLLRAFDFQPVVILVER
jgi:hypothetical protein